MMHAVIMAGGAGTRFWPASRRQWPKQLLDLTGEGSMIQATVNRLAQLIPPERTLVVTNRRLVEPIRHQLPDLPASSVIGEPCKRDTAPCIGVAAAWVQRVDAEAVMIVMPADHIIQPVEAFQEAIRFAHQLVEEAPERLVTFGIPPTYPAESFGYIQRGEVLPSHAVETPQAYRVRRFREKPNAQLAREYVDAGSYYWNSGIFVWKARTILDELQRNEPKISQRIMAIAEAIGSNRFDEVFQREFAAIVGKSIDYAVMEHAKDVVVVEAPFEWDDVGSWQALARLRPADADGNTVDGLHLGIDTKTSIVRGEAEHLIVTVGLDDCLIVHTKDATLVANKHDEERIREVVQRLEEQGWENYL